MNDMMPLQMVCGEEVQDVGKIVPLTRLSCDNCRMRCRLTVRDPGIDPTGVTCILYGGNAEWRLTE